MEYVLEQLKFDEYFSEHKVDAVNRLSHLFMSIKPAIEIYKENPDALLMDCTYKTNYFNIPFEYCRCNWDEHYNSRGTSFSTRGKERDYRFAIEQLRSMMILHNISLPQLILVDCEVAILNVLDVLFPDVPVLLCLWHVEKNIQKKHARQDALQQVRD
ncbi:unnamed protein product [Phytophthora fragariaefolia]|uniref:Unnamed protein product n=1 Tax=Phytophthora fragariaefolia TaxID=1490495 RepID=A0A9W6U1G7_9STRA|nr:unnamed protein product [Phytophthora fragariaefolia]